MGPHNSGVSTGRDVKNTKIALSEASDGSEKDINVQCIKLWRFTMFDIYNNKNQLTVDVPARIFIPSAEKSTAVTGPSCSEN